MLLLRMGPGRSVWGFGGQQRTGIGTVGPWKAGARPLHAGPSRRIALGKADPSPCFASLSE